MIDGHNLIRKMPNLRLDDPDDEKKLIQILQEFCSANQKEADVYFDQSSTGQGKARVHGRVTARYVGTHEEADQAIARHLKRLGKEAGNWTVVSSDRQVQEAAKRARARIVSSEAFAQELTRDMGDAGAGNAGEEEVVLNKDEIDEWMELFGGEE